MIVSHEMYLSIEKIGVQRLNPFSPQFDRPQPWQRAINTYGIVNVSLGERRPEFQAAAKAAQISSPQKIVSPKIPHATSLNNIETHLLS